MSLSNLRVGHVSQEKGSYTNAFSHITKQASILLTIHIQRYIDSRTFKWISHSFSLIKIFFIFYLMFYSYGIILGYFI